MSVIPFLCLVFPCLTGPHRSRGENHEQDREKILQMCSSLDRTLANKHKKAPYKFNNTSVVLGRNTVQQVFCLHLVDSNMKYVQVLKVFFVPKLPITSVCTFYSPTAYFARKVIYRFLL